MTIDIVERLRTQPTRDPYHHTMAHEAADEIARLRAALQELEAACNERAARLTPEAYLLAELGPGMPEAMQRLDAARQAACKLLGPNVAIKRGPTA